MSDGGSYSTAAGEHLVLGQLLRLGVSAYLAQGPTQKGWDIILKRGDELKTVQVKTISWPKEKAVNGKLTSGFDYLVVVLLDRDKTHPRYLVFAAHEVEQFLSKENPERQTKARTLTVSNHKLEPDGSLQKYENNWRVMV
ncbi:hypothetical protein PE066_17795 [Ramlibacter tataouinensis]|uniref:hypothetical protein n=1 Tax=Ramlibacter tataouinensis TaxID=94132 RepID=UPI0022F3DF8D|nr:hypothetical protein [Ramlibacter tataouinensis]WBY01295.1 hypothetical protein PE066_17795 [Ramlibacter tataouinensis]